jgi:guanosine-3',5'-bis(diphosphate) 3'-pyrophosphohydrolase
VFVFTPKGDIMGLPLGATAVDFAYLVHSDVGNNCIAAKINRRMAPLSTGLENGQTIEIVTAPGGVPNPAWLSFVVTSKAKSSIRHYLKMRRRAESIIFGKELLIKALANFSSTWDDIAPQQLATVLEHFKLKSADELFETIGLGNHLPIVVAHALVDRSLTKTSLTPIPTTQDLQPILIKGSEGLVVSFAECCRPIPGDPIVGIFNPGQGLVIHTEQCYVAKHLRDQPERFVNVEWEEHLQGEFKVDLQAEVLNHRGVLGKLASTIAAFEANIEDIGIEAHQGELMVFKLTLLVRDRQHLSRVMRRIRSIKDVLKLSRIR